MPKQIDEIMQLSDNGYVEEHDDIAVILEHFLNYTVEELNNSLPKTCNMLEFAVNVAQKLGDIEITNNSQIEKLKLSDLLCIMKHFEKNFSEPDEILLSYMKNLRSNIACLKGLPWATLFMLISIASLMDFFTEKTDGCEYFAIYRDISHLSRRHADYEIFSQTTLKQLFDGTAGMLYSSWNPGFDKDEYFTNIEKCCLLFKRLFVDGIASYCYEKFNFFEFLGKHNLSEISKN